MKGGIDFPLSWLLSTVGVRIKIAVWDWTLTGGSCCFPRWERGLKYNQLSDLF